jgi:hypothetical protein
MPEVTPPLYLSVDDVYRGAELRLPWRDLVSEGVVGAGDLQVSPTAPAGMSVNVAAGSCWVAGDTDPTRQGVYRCRSSGVVTLVIAPNTGGANRSDTIIAEVLDADFAGTQNLWRLRVAQNTVAVPPNAIGLARITVTPGMSQVGAGSITDLRPRAQGVVAGGLVVPGRVLKLTTWTSPGTATYTPDPSASLLLVECIGGGGGGSGLQASGAGNCSLSSGGGGGGFSTALVPVVAGAYTVTVGAGGAGGLAGANAGQSGGDSQLIDAATGVACRAKGGIGGSQRAVGGTAGVVLTSPIGNNAGLGVGSLLLDADVALAARLAATVAYSLGGAAPRGGGQARAYNNAGASGSDGQPGRQYGGGGTGAVDTNLQDRAGGAGASGMVRVWEYT